MSMQWSKAVFLAGMAFLAGGVAVASSLPDDVRQRFVEIFARCRHVGASEPEADLMAFAKSKGLSKEEMAGFLVQLVDEGLSENADAFQRSIANSALWGLVPFAGEKEFTFVREVMLTAKDAKGTIRRTAIIVGPRMKPEKWEEWLREVVADERSDNYDRFLVFNEAFQIGRDGDEKTRRRVVEVFEEMKTRGVSDANRRHLDEWIAELEKLP